MGDSGAWTTTTIEKIAAPTERAIAIGPFGSALKAEAYSTSGVPVVRGQDIRAGRRLADQDLAFVPEDVAARFPACMVRKGDLVFPHRGAIGQVGIIDDREFLLSSSMMKLTCNQALVDPNYVFYYFRGPGREELLARASTVGTPGIGQPLSSLRGIPIRFPSLSQQRAIAEVLGALDDKIAANDRTLSLLDEWIRVSYQALTGSSVSISALTSNVRSQVRPELVDPEVPYLGLEHLPRRRMWYSESGQASEITSSKFEFAEGDILFGKLRPYFHKVVAAGESGVCSTDILVVRANDPDLRGLVLAACSDDSTIRKCTSFSEGTKMPRTNWSQLGSVSVTWPGEAPAREFSSQAIEKANLAHGLVRESEALANTRDALLPLLMSGKIRVRDAEKVVEEAV